MRCRKARELISLYLAPHAAALSSRSRHALEAHLAVCEPCRHDYQDSQAAIALLRRHWRVSEDTQALLQRPRPQGQNQPLGEAIRFPGRFRQVAAWAMATAACLILGLFAWGVMSNRGASVTGRQAPFVASSGGEEHLVLEWIDGGSRVAPGAALQTSAGEIKSLVLNGKHKVVMNGGTRLSIAPFMDKGLMGPRVNLTRGEVYVQVEHDGHPFVVQTAHGRAVITGTTFDMKVTDAGATLVVVEGSVRWESTGGSVQVRAGQQSTIAGTSARPGAPTACNGIALTTWARSAAQGAPIGQDLRPEDFLWEDLPVRPSPGIQVPTHLERIDSAQWMEQTRAWFQQQFPWIFELQEALTKEGIETDYPALLLQSGDLWRFGYPQAGSGRQVELDPNSLLGAAKSYGRDGSWLQRQGLPSVGSTRQGRPTTASEAFERWASAVQAQADLCPPKVDSGVLLDTVSACLYLAHTRTLAMLAIHNGFGSPAPQVKEEVLGLLQEELRTLAHGVELSYGLDWAKPNTGTCEDLDRLHLLLGEIRKIGELEKRVTEYEKVLRE